MANPTPQQFYTGSHVRTLFGVMGRWYSKLYGHRGQDIAGWPEGTPIPAYRAGKVVADFWSGGLGWCVVLRYSDGKFGGFCHLQFASPLEVGMDVVPGQTVGWVGNTGSLSDGAHLHTTLSTYSTDPGYGQVENPLPYIQAALGSTSSAASFVAVPIPPNPALRKGSDMTKYYRRFDEKIGHFAAGVRVFGSREDYVTHRESVQEYAKLNPTEKVVIPPNENDSKNFVTLDQRHWDIEVALAGGYF